MLYGIFGLVIIVLLFVGVYRRKRESSAWVREERYEESGDWIDKRSGERGSYGRRDREREAERRTIFKQGQTHELALQMGRFLQLKPDEKTVFLREKAAQIFLLAEMLAQDSILPNAPKTAIPILPEAEAFKKHILQHIYDAYPTLLELPIEQIRDFDGRIGSIAQSILETKP